MNGVSTDYKVDVTKWELFFHGGPLAFSNTDSKTRNIASVAIHIAAKFALGLITFGLFTLLRVIAFDKYGNKHDVYIRDEIDKITSMVDVEKLKKVSENAQKKYLEGENGDYDSIYLRAIMTQKGFISETIDLEECFESLSEIEEFPDRWKAALRAVDLYLGRLTEENQSELLEKARTSLNVVKKQLNEKSERTNEENTALALVEKRFERIRNLEDAYTIKILQESDSYLDQIIKLSRKNEKTEEENALRIELVEKYEDSLRTGEKRLDSKPQRTDEENKALELIREKLNEIEIANPSQEELA